MNNANILPIYQFNRSKTFPYLPHGYGAKYSLIGKSGQDTAFPAFQWRIDDNFTPTSLIARDVTTGNETEILADIQAATTPLTFLFDTATQSTRITNYHDTVLPTIRLSQGHYELILSGTDVTTGGKKLFYSEEVHICPDLSNFLKVTYWHDEKFLLWDEIEFINYASTAYKNVIYFDTTLSKPKYPFEEIIKRHEGYNIPITQISEKRHGFEIFAPEFLLDAMRLIRMHTNIEIDYMGDNFQVDDFIPSHEWLDQGHLAVVQVEFSSGTVVRKTAISGAL